MSRHARPTCTGLTCSLLILLAGCGRSWSLNDKVEGTLKLDGTPVPNVFIQFLPDDPKAQGPASTARTDSQGHFELICDNGKSGAVVGQHNVVIIKGVGDSQASSPVIPAVYTLALKTPLQVEVTASEHNYDLKLSANPPPRKRN
jgi:hypothetical protein